MTSWRTLSASICLARATRPTWYNAAAGLTCGSSPLADAVTRSTGMGNELSGSAAFKASMRARTASISAGFVGPRFEPPDAVPLFGIGEVAERRPQKYFGSWNDWPISEEPTALPSRITRLPDAWFGKTALPIPVTTMGYTIPVSTVSNTNNTSNERSIRLMIRTPLNQLQCRQHHVDQLDAGEGHENAPHAVDQEIAAQQRGGAQRAILHAFEGERNQQHDDERVEDHRG